jgi:hypothetical protein
MADPLSVTASIVGLVVPALHGTRLLLNDLEALVQAPKAITRLKEEVKSLDLALGSLRNIDEGEWKTLGATVATQAKATIQSCTQAYDGFRVDVEKWTKHSTDGTLGLRDRAKVGFFKQKQVKGMSEQLQNSKLAITEVVSIATLYTTRTQAR